MRVLVTGHKGYIGSHLFKKLKEDGNEVVGIDLQGCTFGEEEKDGENICDGYPIEYYEFFPEIIFHLAAIPRVGYSINNPVEVMENNINSTSITLRFAKIAKASVIYSSSSSVVGNGAAPTNPYALSKYVGEMETVLYSQLYSVNTVGLRYFNVYSPDQLADGPYATAVSNWMEHIREGKMPFITGDGTQRRDMAHVSDVVSANIFSMNNIKKLTGKVFDVGTGKNISLNEIKEIVNKHHPEIEFRNVAPRPAEVTSTKANIKNFKKFGWNAKIDINEGIEECFRNLKGETR